jgi:hypothetical protein
VHHLRVRAALALLALAPVLAGCSLFGLGAPSHQPVEAYWRFGADGVVEVKPVGDGFDGVILVPRTSGTCPEPKGTLLVKAKGSGAHYTGQDLWWHTPGCDRKLSKTMALDLKDGNKTAHVCSPNPFGGDPPNQCFDMKRLDNYKPPK